MVKLLLLRKIYEIGLVMVLVIYSLFYVVCLLVIFKFELMKYYGFN